LNRIFCLEDIAAGDDDVGRNIFDTLVSLPERIAARFEFDAGGEVDHSGKIREAPL
jgi:hypothetical protein